MTHKTKSCKYCKKRHPVDSSLHLPGGFFCSFSHAIKWANDRVEKTRLLAQARDIKKRKSALKTKGDWMREAQTEFNKFIRLRDQDDNCISCQQPPKKKNAGHYRSVGSCPELRFNELNVHLQCEYCNTFLSSNAIEYRKNLIIKIGIKNVEYIEGPHEPLRLTIDDIKKVKQEYRNKCKSFNKC